MSKFEKPKSLDDYIDKGAPVKADKVIPRNKDKVNFTFSIPKYLLAIIDEELESRAGISRTGWILEAIQEKIKRE